MSTFPKKKHYSYLKTDPHENLAKVRMIPWQDPTWRREYLIGLFGIRTQSPYFLLTIIMLLKAITQRLALEMSLVFIADLGYKYHQMGGCQK